MIVVHSRGMRMVHISRTLVDLCVMEKKTTKKKEGGKDRNFTFTFLDCEEDYWNSGSAFYIRIAKDFHL